MLIKIPGFLTGLLSTTAAASGEIRIDSVTEELKYHGGTSEQTLSEFVPGAGPLTRAGQFRIDTNDLVYHDGSSEQTLLADSGSTKVSSASVSWAGTVNGALAIAHGASFTPIYILARCVHRTNSGSVFGNGSSHGYWDFNGGSELQSCVINGTNTFYDATKFATISFDGKEIAGQHAKEIEVTSVDGTNVNIDRTNVGSLFSDANQLFTLDLTLFG